jgi:hypothetical protein
MQKDGILPGLWFGSNELVKIDAAPQWKDSSVLCSNDMTTLTYEGTVLSDKLQERVLLDVLERAGLTGPDQSLPATVRVKHGQNRRGRTLHYCLNYSIDSRTFD